MRKMKGSPHGLFPVADQGGRMSSFQEAMEKGFVESEFPLFVCEKCGNETVYRFCEECGSKTKQKHYCKICGQISDKLECCKRKTVTYNKRKIKINKYVRHAINSTKLSIPKLIKGVKAVWDKDRLIEPFLKLILRAKNEVYVNKDGTIRFDAIETCITHFKCSEIGINVSKVKELGYTKDMDGKEIINEEQMIELYPQDIIMPDCTEWEGSSCVNFLRNVCNFIDDEFEYLYHMPRFFNIKSRNDLIGLNVISLAPHTSAGMMSRVIGFSKTQGFYAHPYMHAANRRNADGDELGIIVLMDGLLNFSRQFLPDRRGSRTMDAPLVLSVKLDPLEIDGEAYNVDIVDHYPLEFYQAAMECKGSWEVKIKRVEDVLNTKEQFEGIKFTHLSSDINQGPKVSAYKSLPSLKEKMDSQLNLAKKLRCVDADDVARLIIDKHFLKDLKGNLRKYSRQRFRCVSCGEKYRRPPLVGKCSVCNGKVILTIAEGSVKKYMEPCFNLDRNFKLPDYLKQDLIILNRKIEGLFGKPLTKQINLFDI